MMRRIVTEGRDQAAEGRHHCKTKENLLAGKTDKRARKRRKEERREK
jgi:hypothetical protein